MYFLYISDMPLHAPHPDALATVLAVEQARSRWHAQEAARGSGASWSGLSVDAPTPCPAPVLLARAQALTAARTAHRDSPLGSFVAGIIKAQSAAFAAHDLGERARSAAARDFQAELDHCEAATRDLSRQAQTLLRAARSARVALKRARQETSEQ